MQNIILQAIIDGKRRAEANGEVDLNFYAIGGHAAMEQQMQQTRGRCRLQDLPRIGNQAELQSQDDWVRSTILPRGRNRIEYLPHIRDRAIRKGNKGILLNKGLRSGDIAIIKKPHQKMFCPDATYNVVVARKDNKITTEDYRGRRRTNAICDITQLRGFQSVFKK